MATFDSVLKVFTLGDHGVNVSSDPIHTEVGDVVSAQNAYFRGSGERGGLSKRGGLRVMNNSALNGSVLSIIGVTFPDSTPGAILTDMDLVTLTDEVDLILVE